MQIALEIPKSSEFSLSEIHYKTTQLIIYIGEKLVLIHMKIQMKEGLEVMMK